MHPDSDRIRRLAIALVLATAAGCHRDNGPGGAGDSIAWGTNGQLGICLREYRMRKGRYPLALHDLKATVQSSTSYCDSADQLLLDAPNGDFKDFRYTYVPNAAGTGFTLETRPLHPGPLQCTLSMDEDLILLRSCERRLPPWPRVDATDWNAGVPKSVDP